MTADPDRADEATFAGSIPPRRGPQALALVAFVATLGGLVAIGLGGRSAGIAPPADGPAAVASPDTTDGSPNASGAVRATASPSPRPVPIVASDPGAALGLTLRRAETSIYVHGDVYAEDVRWIFVNLVNAEGRVAGWTSVSVPGGAAPRESGEPALRFDVELALPDWSHGPLWIQASAYDAGGAIVASEQIGVWPDGSRVTSSGRGSLGLEPPAPPTVNPAVER